MSVIRTLSSVGATVASGAALAVMFEAGDIADILLVVASVASWTFTVLYATRSRWRLLNAGRSLLYVFAALSIVLTQNALSVWWGTEYPGRGVFRTQMYLGLTVAVIGMLHTLWKIQRREHQTPCPNAAERFRSGEGDEL